MLTVSFRQSPFLVAALLGLLGGLGLILVTAMSNRGPLIYWPYAALLLALSVLVLMKRAAAGTGFGIVFIGFMIASILLYLDIVLVDSPTASSISPVGHAWRLGFVTCVGVLLAAVIAYAGTWAAKAGPNTTPPANPSLAA